MRHFLSESVPKLAHRVHQPSTPALLIALTGDPLPSAARLPRTRGVAVPRPWQVARRAQRHRPAARRILTDDNVQRDHGRRDDERLDIRADL